MAEIADVGVIGAGVIGCAVAEELSRRGASVVVFDARGLGGGATQASAGVLAPYIEAHERGPLFDLTLESLALYDGFIRQVSDGAGMPIEYRRCGTLEVAENAEQAGAQRDAVRAAAGTLEWISGDALRREEPGVSGVIDGAVLCATHGYVSAPQLTRGLALSAERRGVRFHFDQAVRNVHPRPDGFLIEAGGSICTVGSVVVCTGSWTSMLDIASEIRNTVRPIRGQLVRLRCAAPPFAHVLWATGCYLVPWMDGTVLVGATAEDVGFDERATAAGVRALIAAACDLVPVLASAAFVDVLVGLRPASSDGLPVIRPSRTIPRLFYATGHFRNGVLLAPLTARLVADQVENAT